MRTALLFLLVFFASLISFSQNVFNPADPIVRYDKTKTLGTSQNPNPDKAGLQKWVSTPTNGVSSGVDAFTNTSYKAYFLNVGGTKMAFRIKFPYSYSLPEGATKKYPVMLFLHGAGEVGCTTNGGIYNNEKQLWLGGKLFMQRVDNNQFDGFLVYPQLVNAAGDCWGAWGGTTSANLSILLSMVDSLAKYARANVDRLLVNGLSGGGYGAWRMADNYPQRIAKIIPSAAAGSTAGRANFVHIPIFFATGGKDPDPSPAQAEYALTRMKEIGANIRYIQYADLGHSVWTRHWNEPTYIAEMNDMHKANPLVFFMKSDFCSGESINAKLGITAGFYAYEWQKDNVTIATRTNGVNTIVNAASVISYTGNEISVKSFGTYRVRFKRTSSGAWSEWSLKPAVIKAKTIAAAPPITVNGAKSKVLPSLDGSTTAPLQMPSGYINYSWVRVSDNIVVSTAQTYNAPVGVYKAKYDETPGCGPAYSPDFTVVNANGTPKPVAATSLTSTMLTTTSARLNWTQGTGETGFEIYRSTAPGGPYTFISLAAANAVTYTDNTLAANTTYYYVVRAVNETGAAAKSNESSPNGGNKAPVIGDIGSMYVKTDASATKDFTVTDDAGDVVTVTIPYKPGFVTLSKLNATTYRITANPKVDNVGFNEIKVLATDNKGMYSSQSFTLLVADKNTRSVYVNLGASGKTAILPWNNWLGARGAGNIISSLKDENNATTTFSITTVNAWSATSILGHNTGNNSGVYPDAVLESGIADNGAAKQIRIGGLSASKRYNLVFVGSRNEGMPASTEYAVGSQKSVLNAAYNTQKTANLNALAPDASGQILVTATRQSGTGFSYLNAIVIEEFTTGAFLNPDNVYVEPLDRTNTLITWSDKTSNETGFELVRATDSLFTAGLTTISLGANITSYKNTGLAANTKYWYRVRAKNGSAYSGYSNYMGTITPSFIVSVNFNTTVPNAAAPWNNLAASPMTTFTFNNLKNQAGTATSISLKLQQVFNGENTAGMSTGNNSGIVPDNVLKSCYWLDNGQISQIKLSGLNTARKYRIGFVGSMGPNGWFVGDYTATYSVNGRKVYLNAWQNTTKVVYIGDITPDATGAVLLDFSTTASGDWGFNSGIIIQEYTDARGGAVLNSVLEEDSLIEMKNKSQVSVYPNPFNEQFTVDFYNATPGNMISSELYDISGRLVQRNNYNQLPAGHNILQMRTPGYGRNIYLLTLKVNGKIIHSGKLIQRK